MSKIKSPFLGLDAEGSVGNTITAVNRRGVHVIEKKPIPDNPRSLPQMYQRWFYQDYISFWHQLSQAEKEAYRATATACGLTVFAYSMKLSLITLPHLVSQYRLDNNAGGICFDASFYGNHGTVLGTTLATGLIDKCYKFDGVDDKVTIPISASNTNFTAKSVFFFFKCPQHNIDNRTIYYAGFWHIPYGDMIRITPTLDWLEFRLRTPAGVIAQHRYIFTPDVWHHAGYVWDGTTLYSYVDLVQPVAPVAFAGPLACTGHQHYIGRYLTLREYDGYLDHFQEWDIALPFADIVRHSQRRYPL